MGNRVTINKEVAVTAVYFPGKRTFRSFPKRMEFNGHQYTFLESGLRYFVRKGQELVQIFDMTDGESQYRLRFDTHQKLWTLVDITETPRAFA